MLIRYMKSFSVYGLALENSLGLLGSLIKSRNLYGYA